MPKVKCHVLKTGKNENRFWIKTDALESLIGGFGAVPEDIQKAHDNQEEIEIEYHIYEQGDKKYYNHGPPKKGTRSNTGNTNTDAILKTLVMPKLSVGVEKTVQESQYEPKKISVHISQYVENVDPQKIQAMIDLAESEILAKIKGVSTQTEKPTLSKEQETFASTEAEKGLSNDNIQNNPQISEIDRSMNKVTKNSDFDTAQKIFNRGE